MKDGFEDSQIDHENPPVFADVEENKRASPLIEVYERFISDIFVQNRKILFTDWMRFENQLVLAY